MAVAPLDVHLLGRFHVERGGEPIPDSAWSRRNARTLFKYLVLSPGRRCHKEQALDLLWPDFEPAAAANNLHKTLFHLRRVLCPNARGCPYVEFDGETISLAPHLIATVDAEAFAARAQAVQGSTDPSLYSAALDLYAGDLLPDDVYADWTNPRRESLRRTYLNLLRQLGELHLQRREYEPAVAALGHVLDAEPADEAIHLMLMRVFALNGQRHQALRQYHLCRQALAGGLDAEPSPETVALYEAIATGQMGAELTLARPALLPALPHPLIGRAGELSALLRALDAVAGGHPHLAVIVGEAGLGKTRIAQEITRLANERGLPVMVGNTYEPVGDAHELPLPYGPWIEALRRFLDSQPAEVRERLVNPRRVDLAQLLPELGDLGAIPGEPEAARRRLFDSVAGLLGTVAAAQPLVLVLDDVHAADQATVELLGYLLHRPPPFRLFVLALVRQEAIAAGVGAAATPIGNLLARVGRRDLLSRLSLNRLTRDETAQLVHGRLVGDVDERLVETLHELSEGNPLFSEQLLQAWQEQNILIQDAGCWRVLPADRPRPLPVNLRETIALRLNRLSAEAQSMLALAGILGREFSYAWLLASGDWDERALLDLLDQALAARVLEEISPPTGPLVYRFHHGLIRQTLYEGLSEARRRHLHRRVAEVLEMLPGVPYGTLSHHWFATGRWPWAFCHALSAADLAMRAFAHAEAVSLYERALAATLHDWRPDDGLLGRVHLGRAQALMGLNRASEAVTDLEWLVEHARASEDPAAIGQALSRLATAHFWGHNLEAARRLAREALDISVGTGDRITALMCTSNLGCIALSTGRLVEGIGHLETVLEQVRAFGQPGNLVEALACLPGGYHWQGQSARSLPLLEEGIAVARRSGLGFWLGNLLFFAGLAQGSLGRYELALDYFHQGQRHSQDAGDMFTAIRLANSLGWIHHELFDFETALAHDRQGVEMARGFPWPEPLANALVNLGFDRLARSELEAARQAFAEAESLVGHDVWMEWRWRTRLWLGSGCLALAQGNLVEAEDHARKALALAEQTAAGKNQARAHLLLGEVALARGDLTQAATVLRRATELADEVSNPRLLWQSLDALERAERAQGNSVAAVECRSRAREVIQAIVGGLQDESLRQAFLRAEEVQRILQGAPQP